MAHRAQSKKFLAEVKASGFQKALKTRLASRPAKAIKRSKAKMSARKASGKAPTGPSAMARKTQAARGTRRRTSYK